MFDRRVEVDLIPGRCLLTVGLDANVHLGVGGVRDGVTTELDSRAGNTLAKAHECLDLEFLMSDLRLEDVEGALTSS
jgi:hypothetical protein